MPQLTRPTVEVRDSFLGAMDEFREEAGDWLGGNSMIAEEVRVYGARWATPEGFAEYVADVRAAAQEESRPANWVAATVLWYVDGTRWLGRIALRHEYTRHLLDQGGLIGYEVRPTARRRGHATAMLRDALPFAAKRGFDRVLITCDADNVASRKVIESCGGDLEDRRGKKLRYWVPTAPA